MRNFHIIDPANSPLADILRDTAQRARLDCNKVEVNAFSEEPAMPTISFGDDPPLNGCLVWCTNAETASVGNEVLRAKAAFEILPNPPEAVAILHLRSDGLGRTGHLLVTPDGKWTHYPYISDLMRGLTERIGDRLAETN